MRSLLVKFGVVLICTGAGIAMTVAAASPFLAYANANAADRPYFSPPLLALGFLALPYAVVLLLVQAGVAVYEWSARHMLGKSLPLIGITAGLLAGLLWHGIIATTQMDGATGFLLIAAAVMQGLVVFSAHWAANRLRLGLRQPSAVIKRTGKRRIPPIEDSGYPAKIG